jgi:hypothetical protein
MVRFELIDDLGKVRVRAQRHTAQTFSWNPHYLRDAKPTTTSKQKQPGHPPFVCERGPALNINLDPIGSHVKFMASATI